MPTGRAKRLRASLNKRRRFFLVAMVLSLGLWLVQSLPLERRFVAVGVLGVVAYGLSAWALIKDLNGIEWLTDLILPSLFPVAVGLFYFLLPQLLITRLIISGLFMIGMYALLLTANIFAVASIRTIQLLRAARAVGFLLTVLTGAFLFHLILSFRLDFWWNGLLVGGVSWLLFLQALWNVELTNQLSRRVNLYSWVGALAMMEAAISISFWPVEVAMASIFLAMMMYVVLGLMQHLLEGRLFKRTVNEYLSFGVLVLIIVSVFAWLGWTD